MQGTIYNRNFFHRLGDAWATFKAAPSPAQLYPPGQQVQTGFLSFPGWDYLSRNSQNNSRDENNARQAIKNPWVYRNVNAIANEVSTAELVIKQRVEEDEEDIENHPLEQLWEAPNPYMGRGFLMQFWTWQLLLLGEAYLYFVPAAGALKEIWPIPSYMVTPLPDKSTFIKSYAFQSKPGVDPILIDPRYVCYSRLPNPFDIRRGLSPLVAALVDIEGDNAMAKWNANFFSKENAAPTGIMSVPKDSLDTDIIRIRQEVQDFFGGSNRRVAVARAGDLTWTAIDRSQKDMEFLLGRQFTSKLIDTIFGIPEGFWSKDATRANSEGAKATMIENAVWPRLELLREDLNSQIVPLWYGDELRATFTDIRPRNRALELQEFTAYQAVLTVDELRALIDKEEIGDPRGLMLVAEIAKGTPIPATPASDETEDAIAEMEEEAAALEEPLPEEEGAIPLDAETPPLEEGGTVEEVPMKSVVYHGHFGDIVLTDDLLLDAGYTKTDEGWLPPKPLIPELDDLHKWERKAIKALKAGRSAAVRFDTTAVSLPEQERIREALKEAKTVEEVKAAFDGVDSLLDDVDTEARAWAEEATGGSA